MSIAPVAHAGRSIVAAVVSLLLLGLTAGGTLAHAELESSDPADGAVLATNPTTITLTFTENLDPAKSSFKLNGPDGSTIGTGAVTAAKVMTLETSPLAEGTYQVKWTSASADDGDIERGALSFTVELSAVSPSPSVPSSSPSTPPASVAVITPAPSTLAPTPAPSAAPTSPAASTSDVLLPIVVGLLLVAGVGVLILRRSRQA